MDDYTDIRVEGKRVTLHELLEILESCEDNEISESGIDVALMPPLNANEDVTDEDSGPEDHPNIDNLPASQLNSHAELQPTSNHTESNIVPSEPESSLHTSDSCSRARKCSHYSSKTKKQKRITGNWEENDLPVSTVQWPEMYEVPLESARSPLEYFTYFFDKPVIEMITRYTNEYAAKKNKTGDCTPDQITTFIGILLLSGYVVVPRRRMYWQNEKDTYNDLVSNAMSRDKFDFIFSNFHVCSNDDLDKNDRFAKVRPLLDETNARFRNYAPHEENHAVDESMVPYYGRHGCKQFIRGKPIRFGYKFWCGGTSSGYLVWMEPYQGAGTCSSKYKDKGLGYAVVMSYADQLLPGVPYTLFFDNLFTSVDLLKDLKARGIKATGTIRANRVDKSCDLSSPEDMKKKKRGTFEYRSNNEAGISLVRWHDNSVVSVATNFDTVYPLHQVGRFSREKKKKIQVSQPHLIHVYNKNMGGVDRADQNISLYRISIRGKKWYFPILTHIIDVAEQNAWALYRKDGGKLDHLSFRRRVATAILESSKRVTTCRGRPSASSKVDSRYDGTEHYVANLSVDPRTSKKRQLSCRRCGKKATTECIKCEVPLHVDCFISFHTI